MYVHRNMFLHMAVFIMDCARMGMLLYKDLDVIQHTENISPRIWSVGLDGKYTSYQSTIDPIRETNSMNLYAECTLFESKISWSNLTVWHKDLVKNLMKYTVAILFCSDGSLWINRQEYK